MGKETQLETRRQRDLCVSSKTSCICLAHHKPASSALQLAPQQQVLPNLPSVTDFSYVILSGVWDREHVPLSLTVTPPFSIRLWPWPCLPLYTGATFLPVRAKLNVITLSDPREFRLHLAKAQDWEQCLGQKPFPFSQMFTLTVVLMTKTQPWGTAGAPGKHGVCITLLQQLMASQTLRGIFYSLSALFWVLNY